MIREWFKRWLGLPDQSDTASINSSISTFGLHLADHELRIFKLENPPVPATLVKPQKGKK